MKSTKWLAGNSGGILRGVPRMPRKLVHGLRHGATRYWIQSVHRKSALEYLIHGTELVHEETLKSVADDPFAASVQEIMPAWAVETLAQGAYVREFHIWEKEVKEYFFDQLRLNLKSVDAAGKELKKRGEEKTLVDVVHRLLSEFDVDGLDSELEAINQMRVQVNKAKHDPGVLVDHFVSIQECWEKHAIIQSFWLKLIQEQSYHPSASV